MTLKKNLNDRPNLPASYFKINEWVNALVNSTDTVLLEIGRLLISCFFFI